MRNCLHYTLFVLALVSSSTARAQTPDEATQPTPLEAAPAPQLPPAAAPTPGAPPPSASAVSPQNAQAAPATSESRAQAATFDGKAGTIGNVRLVLSAESIASVWYTRFKEDDANAASSHIHFQLLSLSELGADYLFEGTPIWTLGGQVRLDGGWSRNDDRVTSSNRSFAITPRGGVILGDGDAIRIWLRAGIAYGHINNDSDSSSSVGIVLSPNVIVSPAPHVALTFGPMVRADSVSYQGGARPGYTTVQLELRSGISLLL